MTETVITWENYKEVRLITEGVDRDDAFEEIASYMESP